MNYYHLGKLPASTIDHFKLMIRELIGPHGPDFQSLQFTQQIKNEFKKIFDHDSLMLEIKPNQKAFYTRPNYTAKIHKDGFDTNAALNIAITCNPTDWVRWHSEEQIASLGIEPEFGNQGHLAFRRVPLLPLDDVPYIESQTVEPGDVYLVNTNVWHSFKCSGANDRIIIQTKFASNPTIETLKDMLEHKNFKNLVRPEGFEPPTYDFEDRNSIQLS